MSEIVPLCDYTKKQRLELPIPFRKLTPQNYESKKIFKNLSVVRLEKWEKTLKVGLGI